MAKSLGVQKGENGTQSQNCFSKRTMYKTGLILAAGEGKRMKPLRESMGVPKQLLPLPNGETIAGRLATSLGKKCDQIICAIRSEADREQFAQALSVAGVPVQIHVKQNPIEYTELAEIAHAFPLTGNIIQTNGDLIFPDGVVEGFIDRYGDCDYFVRGREGNRANQSGALDIFNSRISVLPARELALFSPLNKRHAVVALALSLILNRVDKVPTLFNVDTPEDYQRACEYLKKS